MIFFFTFKWILQKVLKSLKRELEHVEHLNDDPNTLVELEEDVIEVKPELQRTQNPQIVPYKILQMLTTFQTVRNIVI